MLDFGVTKLADPINPDASGHTRVEDVVLTPDYAAPEQLLGEPVSTATDIYQVGILMYVLLAGCVPLSGTENPRAERIRAALRDNVARLSAIAPPLRRKALRGDLDAIALKAVAREPVERYDSASAMRDDL